MSWTNKAKDRLNWPVGKWTLEFRHYLVEVIGLKTWFFTLNITEKNASFKIIVRELQIELAN